MKRLTWFLPLLFALPITAQPYRGGPSNNQAVFINDCVTTSGACPANGYVCVLPATKVVYQCKVSTGWRQVSIGGASNAPASGQCATWDSVNSTVKWNDCGSGGGGGGTSTIQESGATVSSIADTLNFGSGFDLTETSSGKVAIALDYSEDRVDLTTTDVTGTLPIANGGTGQVTVASARAALAAAASGPNSDITSLTGLSTPLGSNFGGLGINTGSAADDSVLVYSTGAGAWQLKTIGNCPSGNQLLYIAASNSFSCEGDGSGGTGSLKIVQEEGASLGNDSSGTTLNFVSSSSVSGGVGALVASGLTSVKTITLSQSGTGTAVIDNAYTINPTSATDGLTGGGALTGTSLVLDVASTEATFITDGGASDLSCGGTTGKMQVMDNGVLQFCDGSAVLRYGTLGSTSGQAQTGDNANSFFAAGVLEVTRGGTGAAELGVSGDVLYNASGAVGHDGTTSEFSYNQSTNVLTVGSVNTSGATEGNRYLEMQGNTGGVGTPATGFVRLYASGSVGSEALKYYTFTGGIKTVATLSGNETLINKALSGDSNDLSIRVHATDCTSLMDGVSGELCYEQDADTIYACDPTSAPCDTPTEWRATSSAGSGDITDVWNCASGDCSSVVAAAGDSMDANAMTGANAFRLPYQATNSVSSAGAFTIDSTADQLVYFGAAERVIPYIMSASAVLESLVSTDDNYEFWEAPYGVTITTVSCYCRGTCTTEAKLCFEDRTGNNMSLGAGTDCGGGTTVARTCTKGGGVSSYTAVSSGGGLVTGEGLAFDVSNSPTTGDTYTVTVTYTATRQ